MTVLLTTGDENADQQMDVYVQGRSSPMRVQTQSGVPAGLVPPLSTTLFGDVGTSAPVPTQDGSIALPFATLAQIIAATGGANDFTAMLSPGTYALAALGAQELSLVGLSAGQNTVVLSQVTCNQSSLRVANANVFVDATDCDLHFENCTAGVTFHAPGGSADFRGSTASGTLTDATFVYFRDGSSVGTNVTAVDCFVENSAIDADITCTGTLRIRQLTSVTGTPTLTADVLDIDAESLRMLVFAGATLTANTFQGFTGETVTWGALLATTAEFLPLGTRENATSNANEDAVNYFATRRCVACFMRGYSSGDLTYRFRLSGVDSLLTVNVNNSIVNNRNTFVEVPQDSQISLGVTNAGAAAQAIVSVLLV